MRTMIAIFAAALLCVAGFTSSTYAQDAAANAPQAESAKLVATRMVLRNLWANHIFWVRSAVVAKHDKNSTAEKIAEEQIVANAHQIADAIIPFYGEAASEQLFGMLAGHWGAIKGFLDATDAGDNAAAQKASAALFANAAQIAKFLSGANPAWPYDAVNQMLVVHGSHHMTQIKDIYAGNYENEAKVWQQMRDHMDALGDALAAGLNAAFPDKF